MQTEHHQNLVTYWPLDALINNQVLDAAAYSHGVAINTPAVVDGVIHRAVSFNPDNGSGDYIEGGVNSGSLNFDDIGALGDFTVSLWVKLTDLTTYQPLITKGNSASNTFYLAVDQGYIKWSAGNSAVQSISATGLAGQWIHLALVGDSQADAAVCYLINLSFG